MFGISAKIALIGPLQTTKTRPVNQAQGNYAINAEAKRKIKNVTKKDYLRWGGKWQHASLVSQNARSRRNVLILTSVFDKRWVHPQLG